MTLTGLWEADSGNEDPNGPNGAWHPITDFTSQGSSVFEKTIGPDGLVWNFNPSNGIWKWASSAYPYPILRWMPDNSNPLVP